ncbi:MAG: hypothetical protein ACJA1C_000985 [Crocinitomicaceae bacterium]|jgi:hypothetical protein
MNYEILITSVPDREKRVAEIWQGEALLAEINQENEDLELQIYTPDRSSGISVDYKQFMKVLDEAKNRLLN